MGPENPDLFYHITDDTIVPSYNVTSHFGSSKVIQDEITLPPYVKGGYCESPELLVFYMLGTADDTIIRTIYNKKTGHLMHLHSTNDKAATDPDYKVPSFRNGYKDFMFNYISVSKILKDDNLRAQFPNITEDSNPVIQIYRPK